MDSIPDHQPLPLSHAVAFNIRPGDKASGDEKSSRAASEGGAGLASTAAPADAKAAAAGAEAGASLSPAEVASGKRWSAKVLLMSGVPEAGLHAQDFKLFQVGKGRGWGRVGVGGC